MKTLKRHVKKGVFITLGVLISCSLIGNAMMDYRYHAAIIPTKQEMTASQDQINQGFAPGQTVYVYPTVIPTEIPAQAQLTEFESKMSSYHYLFENVPQINLSNYAKNIEDQTRSIHPETFSLADASLEGRINVAVTMNRGPQAGTSMQRYSPDIIGMISIDPADWSISLINLPREVYVPEMGQYGTQINRVEWTKGYSTADFYDTLTRLTGLYPHMHLHVSDSHLFVEIIDKVLGGIDITISERVSDPNYNLYFEPGTYHVDGYTAVYLAVSRNAPAGSGFRRNRQNEIFESIINKMVEVYKNDPVKLIDTMEILSRYENTDHYENIGSFFFRKTSDAYAYDQANDKTGRYAHDYFSDQSYNLSKPSLLWLTLAIAPEMMDNPKMSQLNEWDFLVSCAPEIEAVRYLKCTDPKFFRSPDAEPWPEYYVQLRAEVLDFLANK